MGTLPPGVWKPMFCSSRYCMTPVAASRPNAEPPASVMAWILSMALRSWNKSVSRVPGADPRTSTPPVAPSRARMTVVPVMASKFWAWPTWMPGTSVIAPGYIFYQPFFCFC